MGLRCLGSLPHSLQSLRVGALQPQWHRIDTMTIPDPGHPWSGWLFKTWHRLRCLRTALPCRKIPFCKDKPSALCFKSGGGKSPLQCGRGLQLSFTAFPAGWQRAVGTKLEMQEPGIVPSSVHSGSGVGHGGWQKPQCFLPCLIPVLPLIK